MSKKATTKIINNNIDKTIKDRYNYNTRKYIKEGIQVKFESFTLLFQDELPLKLIALRNTKYKEINSKEEILSIVEILKIVFD